MMRRMAGHDLSRDVLECRWIWSSSGFAVELPHRHTQPMEAHISYRAFSDDEISSRIMALQLGTIEHGAW